MHIKKYFICFSLMSFIFYWLLIGYILHYHPSTSTKGNYVFSSKCINFSD